MFGIFRPAAKFAYIVLFMILAVFSLCGVYLYTNTSLDLTESIDTSEIMIEIERESLINPSLFKFYVRALSDISETNSIIQSLDDFLERVGAHYAVKSTQKIKVRRLTNKCNKNLNCVRLPMSLNEISGIVWRALIGIEDSRYLGHKGLDYKSIARAFYVNLVAGRIVQGGSTLTQQLVKNIFLSSDRTISRKLIEAFYATILELKYTKKQLIEAYLNNVYWGSFNGINLYGIKAASLFYFNRTPNELDEYQSSVLIAMLKGPGLYSPFHKNKNHLVKRSNLVFEKLVNEKFLSGKKRPWSRQEWDSWFRSRFTERSLFFKSLFKIKNLSFEEFVLSYSLEKKISYLSSKYPRAEFAYHVIGLNLDGEKDKIDLSSRKSVIKLNKNIGSLLKPLVYAEIFKVFDPSFSVSSRPLNLHLKSGKWSPSDQQKSSDEVTLSFALLRSLNIPFVRIVSSYGFSKIEKFLTGKKLKLKTPLSEYPSQLLGSLEMNLYEVSSLYEDFFSLRCRDRGVIKVMQILSSPSKSTTRKWVDVIKSSSFFGKTGTSNNGYDNWYVFYDTRQLFVVWFGHVGKRNIGRLALSGGGVSFDLFREFLTSRAKNIGQGICDE